MRTQRVILDRVSVDGRPVAAGYADLFVVLRDGSTEIAWTDWEVNITSDEREHITPERHDLHLRAPDGSEYFGPVIVRFSDGRRHLFRGDGELAGVSAASWYD